MHIADIITLEQEEKRKRLIWSVTVRFLVLFIILIVVLIGYSVGFNFYLPGIFAIVTIVFLYNIVSHFFYDQKHYPAIWPYLGIIIDMLVITVLVHFTGGAESVFLPLYLLQVVGTNVHFSRIAGPLNFFIGGGSMVTLLILEQRHILPHLHAWPGTYEVFAHPQTLMVTALTMVLLMGVSTYRSGYVLNSLENVEKKLALLNKDLVRMNKSFELANMRLRELDQLKTDFISVASHQLRTPLSAIKWALKMIIDKDVGPVTKEQKDLLQKGYQTNERMISLINDLLNVSRIEEQRFQYRFAETSLAEVIDKTLDELRIPMEKKSILFEKRIEHHIPPLFIDGQKMHLVFENLLDNAIKYTPDGGRIVLTVSRKQDVVLCLIHDSGVGIPESQWDRVFSKFFRGDNVIRMQTQGTGLGLFIARTIIEKHNGTITFDSKEGEGTTFSFTLPIEHRS